MDFAARGPRQVGENRLSELPPMPALRELGARKNRLKSFKLLEAREQVRVRRLVRFLHVFGAKRLDLHGFSSVMWSFLGLRPRAGWCRWMWLRTSWSGW